MTALPDQARARTLRLVTAEEIESADGAWDGCGLSPAMTWTQFVDAFVVPVALVERNASRKTADGYRKTTGYWREFTGDPAIGETDDFDTARFLQGLYGLAGRAPEGVEKPISPATVHKHVRNMQAVFNLAGPRTRTCRKAQRLIEEVPYLERPRLDHGEVDDNFTLDEIAQILEGAKFMKAPRVPGVPPPAWWRSLVTLAYNTAERRYALLHVEQPPQGAKEIIFPRGIRKGHVLTNRVPLNEWAQEAIESIRTDRRLLYPWPYSIKEQEQLRGFGRRWQWLLKKAGIPEDRRFGLHGLRKATGTEMAGANPMAAMQMLGHQQWATFQKHYAGRSIKEQAVNKLPQPGSTKRKPVDDPNQRLLF